MNLENSLIAKLRWVANERKPGTPMAIAPDGRFVFPSIPSLPCPDERGMAREELPIIGQEEECLLVLAPGGTVYHAYPLCIEEVQIEEARGVVEIDGHVIVLRNPDYRVGSAIRKDGRLIITIE